MPTRREFITKAVRLGAAVTLSTHAHNLQATETIGVEVSDVQSQLNLTRVHSIVRPKAVEDIQEALRTAQRDGRAVSVAGGRHAMGGQQFGRDTILIDTTPLNSIISFDKIKGHIEVQGGIEWPELIGYLIREQAGQDKQWSIREKQTGIDRVSLGGSLASNIHGRGLRFTPIIGDIESFVLIDAQGKLHTCNRRENMELFRLAIGGYWSVRHHRPSYATSSTPH